MNRIIIYSSAFLGMYLIYAVLLLLSYFNLISLKLSLVINLVGLYDIAFVMFNIIRMFYLGAYIN